MNQKFITDNKIKEDPTRAFVMRFLVNLQMQILSYYLIAARTYQSSCIFNMFFLCFLNSSKDIKSTPFPAKKEEPKLLPEKHTVLFRHIPQHCLKLTRLRKHVQQAL